MKGAHAFHVELEAPLVHAGDGALDDLADLEGFPGDVGGGGAFGHQQEQAFALVVAVDGEFHLVADFGLGLEMLHRGDALGLAAEVDEDVVFRDLHHAAAADGAVAGGRVLRSRRRPARGDGRDVAALGDRGDRLVEPVERFHRHPPEAASRSWSRAESSGGTFP
jgi:hypothetical protein